MMTIMHLIQHAKDLEEGKDYNILDLYMKVPFLELERSSGQYWSDIARTVESPRVMRTYLPHQIWKDNIDKHPNVKIIQTIRNPKDTLVSYYHHFRSDAMIGRFNGSWDQFFQRVKDQKLSYGDMFHHTAEWYKFNVDRTNSLILEYEDMKKNPRSHVIKIANFLGQDIPDSKTIDLIVEKSSFKTMGKKINSFFKYNKSWDSNKSQFIRKGEIGDWVNYFSNEQSTYIDDRSEELLHPLGLTFNYA